MTDQAVTIKINEKNYFTSKRAAALGLLALGWLILSVFHVVTGGGSYWLNLIVLTLALLPTAAVLVRPKDIQNDADAYRTFARMCTTQVILTVLMLLAASVADALGRASAWGRVGQAVVALPVLLGACQLAADLVLLYRYRSRRSVSGMAIAFTYELIGIVVVALVLPLFIGTQRGETRAVVMPLAGLVVLFGMFLSLRNSWIVNLRKDRKWRLLGYALLGMISASGLVGLLQESSVAGYGLLWMSPAVGVLVFGIAISTIILCISVFFGTLVALPTAGTIDRRNAEVASLRTLTRLLTGSFETQQLIDTSLSIACDATGAPVAWMQVESGSGSRTLYGTAPRLPAQQAVALMNAPNEKREPLSYAVRQRRKTEVLENVTVAGLALPGKDAATPPPRPLKSVAAVPLVSGNTLVGVLYIAHEVTDGFDREDLNTLHTVADQIAVALEHSQLVKAMIERERLQQEMLLAQNIQQRLLPRTLPQSPFFDLHAESQPASIVGGDYYDVTSFSDQTLGVIIADVAGKGAGAALYMGVVKGVVQALTGVCADPHELLSKINAALYGSVDRKWFVTMTCAQILEGQRTLRIARAGHCPTLLLRGGRACYSRPKGMGLGLAQPTMFGKTLELETVDFQAGDCALFLSDGLPEATSPAGEEFGYDRLAQAAETAMSKGIGSAHELRNEIFTAISTFARGQVPRDDSTVAIIRWR